jgi:hypothetical protein
MIARTRPPRTSSRILPCSEQELTGKMLEVLHRAGIDPALIDAFLHLLCARERRGAGLNPSPDDTIEM